jgi:hypothetical protein
MRLTPGFTAFAVALLAVGCVSAQSSDEFSLTVGALSGGNPNAVGGPLDLGSNVAFQANFAHRYRDMKWAALYFEVNVMGSPVRHLSGTPVSATNTLRSVFVTPGLRLQFAPQERLTPFLDAGGGYAFYDSSSTSIAGGVTPSSGTTSTYAVDFGGGVDIVASKRYVIRTDARGFYTGHPNFGVTSSGGLFNFVLSAGVVWTFGR